MNGDQPTGLIPATTVAAIVGSRDAAIAAVQRGAELIAEGHRLASEGAALARTAHQDAAFHEADHDKAAAFQRLFSDFNAAASVEAFRKNTDARTWVRLVELSGIRRLMDRTATDDLYKDLAGDVPAITEDAIRGMLLGLGDDAKLIFQRGLARAFIDLDSRFKSHDAFKLGSRMILTRMFDDLGYWNYHNRARETITDVERVFAVLDGSRPDAGSLIHAIDRSRQGHHGPRQGVCESTYFRIRTFMNGNAHLWFTRDDLVEKANATLADYYGAVLPDGVGASQGPEGDLFSSCRELSRDLAFYPTPEKVARLAVSGLQLGPDSLVLEPSAGVGGIVRVLLESGASVTAVEVDDDRHAALGRLRGRLSVVRANFLRFPAKPVFSHVVMNPPFFGTHWIDHVVHAFAFLRPHGHLVAVLPATAEIGESRRHDEFRAWAAARSARGAWCQFSALPPESFAESGTRVQTVLLHLKRGE